VGPLNLELIGHSGGSPLQPAEGVTVGGATDLTVDATQNLARLSITAAGVFVTSGMDKVLHTGSLAIEDGDLKGILDLANNSLQVHYSDADPFGQVRKYLLNHNILSNSADARHNLGYADSADKVVKGLADKTVLVKYALYGDANLDGRVNFADLLLLAQGYGKDDANWDQGDFNYDRKVTFDDLLRLAQNYGGTVEHPTASRRRR
jgi:hypothetical protein